MWDETCSQWCGWFSSLVVETSHGWRTARIPAVGGCQDRSSTGSLASSRAEGLWASWYSPWNCCGLFGSVLLKTAGNMTPHSHRALHFRRCAPGRPAHRCLATPLRPIWMDWRHPLPQSSMARTVPRRATCVMQMVPVSMCLRKRWCGSVALSIISGCIMSQQEVVAST